MVINCIELECFRKLTSIDASGGVAFQIDIDGLAQDCGTVKPVYNDHLYNKIYYLWFIQKSVLMKTECTNLLLLTISAFWSSSRWPLAT